jgi:MSHA biogenesis protein MshL
MIRFARRMGAAAAVSAALLSASLAFAPVAFAAPADAERRFDLSVNNAPAAQVFMQMAVNTPYNVLVSPEVTGNVSITLKNATLPEAMEAMRELFGYDYRITGNRIFVQPNTVQTRLFKVSYLPGRRQGASDLRVSSSSITQSNAGGNGSTNGTSSGSGNNNSGNSGNGQTRQDDSAHVRTTSDADFWREVNSSLNALVGAANGRSVVLNPSAGVVVVKATPNELRQVEQYLKAVQLSIERQVMLEAKIVEVSLSKDAQAGVNWGAFGKIFGNVSAAIGMAAPNVTLQTTGALIGGDTTVVTGQPGGIQNGGTGRGFYGLALQASNFAALINFLQTQGDVQVLSSPRIATLNNQKAVLKVGSDELFVTGITSNTTSSGNNTVSSPTLTLTPFFSGIVLDVTPQIDEDGQVMLHVHPAISTVVEKQKNVDLGSLGNFRLPLATSTVNETDSIVRVRDGQFVAIGGLMVQHSSDERTGVPGAQDVPVLGGLFRQTAKVSTKRELVILMKPTIIRDGGWPEANVPGTAAVN